jgi:hypothetical protein
MPANTAMDGLSPTTSALAAPTHGRRPARLLAALATLVVVLALAAAPARAADNPAARWPVGGAALATAMSLATEHWGMSPCNGEVALSWTGGLGPGVNAQSSWANDVDPYRQPSRNSDCAIALSTRVQWDWPMLCTVVIHEVGHLTGHDHVDDEHDIMYYAYVEPAYECTTTAEPLDPGAGPAAPPAAVAKPRRAPGKAAAPAARAKAQAGATKAKARPKPKAKGRKAAARGRR